MKRLIYLLISAVAGASSQHLSAQQASDATRQDVQQDSQKKKVRDGRAPQTPPPGTPYTMTYEQELDARALIRGARVRLKDAPPAQPVVPTFPAPTPADQALAQRLLEEQQHAIEANLVQQEILTGQPDQANEALPTLAPASAPIAAPQDSLYATEPVTPEPAIEIPATPELEIAAEPALVAQETFPAAESPAYEIEPPPAEPAVQETIAAVEPAIEPTDPIYRDLPPLEPAGPAVESIAMMDPEPAEVDINPQPPVLQSAATATLAPTQPRAFDPMSLPMVDPIDPNAQPVSAPKPAAPIMATAPAVMPAPVEPASETETALPPATVPEPEPMESVAATEPVQAPIPAPVAAPAPEPVQTYAPEPAPIASMPPPEPEPIPAPEPMPVPEPVIPSAPPAFAEETVAPPTYETPAPTPAPPTPSEVPSAEAEALQLLEQRRIERLGITGAEMEPEAADVLEQIRAAKENQAAQQATLASQQEAEHQREIARIEAEVLRAKAMRESQTVEVSSSVAPEPGINNDTEAQARAMLAERRRMRVAPPNPNPPQPPPAQWAAPAPTPEPAASTELVDELEAALLKAEAEARARTEEADRLAREAPAPPPTTPPPARSPVTSSLLEPANEVPSPPSPSPAPAPAATQQPYTPEPAPGQNRGGLPMLSVQQMTLLPPEPSSVAPETSTPEPAPTPPNLAPPQDTTANNPPPATAPAPSQNAEAQAALQRARAIAAARAAQARSTGAAVPVLNTRELQQHPPPAPAPQSDTYTKEQRLEQLLEAYKANKLTPAEYHRERIRILAEP